MTLEFVLRRGKILTQLVEAESDATTVVAQLRGQYSGVEVHLGTDLLDQQDRPIRHLSLGFTTGGGWFYWPGSEDKTTFGYTMKYNKKGTKVQGSLSLIRHMPDGSIFRIKSNSLNGLSIGEGDGFGWASFSGKNTYKEPGWLDAIGAHNFVAYVEDNGELGAGVDRFWLEVKDKDGNTVTLAFVSEAVENAESLGGGNIVVPHEQQKGSQ